LNIIKKINQINIREKSVLIRVDFNVPMNGNEISSDFRLKASMETIKYCIKEKSKIIIMSHLGRPKSKESNFSLHPIYLYLKKYFDKNNVIFSEDCLSEKSINISKNLNPTEIHLLENLRFYSGELNNSETFAFKLSQHAEIYVNDAFGTSHRSHASNSSILNFFKKKCFGFLMDKELNYLTNLKLNKKFGIILGGAKVSTKLGMINHFLDKADSIFIGGGMSFTFLKSMNKKIGNSLFEKKMLGTAKEILEKSINSKTKILLPEDFICAKEISSLSKIEEKSINDFSQDDIGLDIGNKTIDLFLNEIKSLEKIIWNGPMGVFEIDLYKNGTTKLAETISHLTSLNNLTSIVGGGDTASAIIELGLSNNFTHVSTGGGASLKLLSGEKLELIQSWGNND